MDNTSQANPPIVNRIREARTWVARVTRLVGATHYPGAVTEMNRYAKPTKVILVREPDNPYDRNAVAVHARKLNGQTGIKLGHVPREVAPYVAFLMDETLYQIIAEVSLIPGGYRLKMDAIDP